MDHQSISINKQTLEQAARAGILAPQQIEGLWQFCWQQQVANPVNTNANPDQPHASSSTPRFDFAHVLYYFGGLIAIGALTLFTTLGFSQMGFGFLTVVAIGYLVLFVLLTEVFLRRHLTIPAGIMSALAVCMVPMAIFSIQNLMNFWQADFGSQNYRDYHVWIDWRWIFMELGTLAFAALMFYRYRLPFMMMPVAVTGWYMSMDIAAMISHGVTDYSSIDSVRRSVAIVVGLIMVIISLLMDRRYQRRPDLGFWLCLFGAISFWGGVSWSSSDVWWHKHAYAALCIAMILSGALIQRRVFTILGALSFSGYLGWLSYSVFDDSLLFPIVLSGIGLGIVAFGIWWHKNEAHIVAGIKRTFGISSVTYY